MCEFSGKLIAMLDGELPAGESADVEQHVRVCAECRSQLRAYGTVSASFDAYCQAYCAATMASKVRRRVPRLVLSMAGAAAVAAVLFLALVHTRLRSARTGEMAAASARPFVSEAEHSTTVPLKHAILSQKGHQGRLAPPAPRENVTHENVTWIPAEPAIQIAIPVEAMFPPGAVPEGVSFAADLTIAMDGSAQWLRLRP